MGMQSSIDITLNNPFDLNKFLGLITNYHWTLTYNNSITYLPENDLDFDWEIVKSSDYDMIINILERKKNKLETVGFSMYHSYLHTGFLFHYFPQSNKLMLLLTYDRIKIGTTRFTNFTIYLEEIYKIINQDEIESITCQDTY